VNKLARNRDDHQKESSFAGPLWKESGFVNHRFHSFPACFGQSGVDKTLSSGHIDVEVVSFFFLRCAPCIGELSGLDDLQKRYARDKVLVADVTTYKAALN